MTFASSGHVDSTTLAGIFRSIWRSSVRKGKHKQRQFLAKSLKMEDWDIPNEDDFESRYADELEMLDDFEGKCLL